MTPEGGPSFSSYRFRHGRTLTTLVLISRESVAPRRSARPNRRQTSFAPLSLPSRVDSRLALWGSVVAESALGVGAVVWRTVGIGA